MHAVFVAVFSSVVERLSVGSSRDDDDEASSGFPRRVGAECVRDDRGVVEGDDVEGGGAVSEAVFEADFADFATPMDLPKAKLFAAGAGLVGLLYFLKKRKKQTFDANNKTILITGASSGIGLSMAILYARQGARLVLNARSEDALAAAERAVLDAGAAGVLSVRGDVATAEGRAALVEKTADFCGEGALDLLVLNAGISMGETVEELVAGGEADAVVRRLMEVNYFGSVGVLMPLLPSLSKADAVRVVGVNSVVGLVAPPTRSGYAASKMALGGFLDSLRVELRMSGKRAAITQAYPGNTATGINDRRLGTGGQRPLDFRVAMTADAVAAKIVAGVAVGARDIYFPVSATSSLLKVHALRVINCVYPALCDALLYVPGKKK